MDIRLSTIVNNVKDYNMTSNDERTLFDWLVIKQYDFGLGKPFTHSVAQVQEATLTTKYIQKQTFEKFVKMGFLTLGTERYLNNPYRTYFVDFFVLSKPEIIGQLIKPETKTYCNLISVFSHWASEQKKALKPLSKKRQKEMELEAEAVEKLHTRLVGVWNSRVEKYNKGELTPGKKPAEHRLPIDTFVPSSNDKKLMTTILKEYSADAVTNAFMVFADDIFTGRISPRHPLPYFLTREEGVFTVMKELYDYFTMKYVTTRG